ncbi:MAG: AAA family ATPase [Acidobacteria bacterium]|nr:AAA family ATPase [Acidobacteriota bacterium]
MFEDFFGNAGVAATLEQMIGRDRIPQTILLAGPEGVGKATLARRFAARLLGGGEKIERDDPSLPANAAYIAEREKWPADKRGDDPLLFGSHPDFLTFPPDGPLRQILMQQMRLLRDRAQFMPRSGRYRVFLIDHIDRANEQAANSLLKTLEEPPEHLILIATAENAYDLLPTIRSRSVIFHMAPLERGEMARFVTPRRLDHPEKRIALAAGSPGLAVSLDIDAYEKRRSAMLALLQVAAGRAPFGQWLKYSESIGMSKTEKLEYYLKVLYILLEDLLVLQHGAEEVRNSDIRRDLEAIAPHVSFEWLYAAVKRVDDLVEQLRRNIQKSIALDALILGLREAV